jgi:hypothetical protein
MKGGFMKVLTLRQPYASLVILGIKKYETRQWYMKHRGPILIHAAKHPAHNAQRVLRSLPHFPYSLADLPTQAIIGQVTIAQCFDAAFLHPDAQQYKLGFFQAGYFAYELTDPLPTASPLPHPGKMGLWELDDDQLKGLFDVPVTQRAGV